MFANVPRMRQVTLPLPVLGFVVATRVLLAAGLGLLVADRLEPRRRRSIARVLVGIGAATTIPAAWLMSRGIRGPSLPPGVQRDERLIAATRYPRKGDEPL
jgi:hypothetical protein